jgi:hypothetical protein
MKRCQLFNFSSQQLPLISPLFFVEFECEHSALLRLAGSECETCTIRIAEPNYRFGVSVCIAGHPAGHVVER